jgi:hypothetical protein
MVSGAPKRAIRDFLKEKDEGERSPKTVTISTKLPSQFPSTELTLVQ